MKRGSGFWRHVKQKIQQNFMCLCNLQGGHCCISPHWPWPVPKWYWIALILSDTQVSIMHKCTINHAPAHV